MSDTEAQSAPPADPVEDKPQPERKVIATAVQGTVKWFNVRNGYGFINRNDTKEDVFVHQTAIRKNNPRKFLRSVGDGEVVEFDVIEATKGCEAANVTGPGGIPVKGSRYAPNKRRFRRRFFPRSPGPLDSSKPGDDQAPPPDVERTDEAEATRPPPRRRRPRRPRQDIQDGDAGDEKDGVAEGDQGQQQRPQRRRFWRPYRRPPRPRPPLDPTDQKSSATEDGKEEQGEAKQVESPEGVQINGEPMAEGQDQKPHRPPRLRRQRNSESSASKNDTEKLPPEPGSPPKNAKPTEKPLPKSPKTSPKISTPPKSLEEDVAPAVEPRTE